MYRINDSFTKLWRRDDEESARVSEEENIRRRSQEEEETSSSVRSSVADELLNADANKAEEEILSSTEEMIAPMTAYKDREAEEAVERVIMECRRGLKRAVLEVRSKFEAESAEYRKRVVKEAVSILRERHDS